MNVERKHILRAKRSGVDPTTPSATRDREVYGRNSSTAPPKLYAKEGRLVHPSLARTTRSEIGQGLIEVLAALTIAMIVLSALSVAAITSLRNATFSKNQNQANAYARQTIDSIRAYRDLYKTHFFTREGCFVLSQDLVQPFAADRITPAPNPLTPDTDNVWPCNNGSLGGDTTIGNGFRRRIFLDLNGDFNSPPDPTRCPLPLNNSCTQVTVYVFWTDSSGTHSSQLSSIFGKWQ